MSGPVRPDEDGLGRWESDFSLPADLCCKVCVSGPVRSESCLPLTSLVCPWLTGRPLQSSMSVWASAPIW